MNVNSPGLFYAAQIMEDHARLIDATLLDMRAASLEGKVLNATAEYCRETAELFKQEASK